MAGNQGGFEGIGGNETRDVTLSISLSTSISVMVSNDTITATASAYPFFGAKFDQNNLGTKIKIRNYYPNTMGAYWLAIGK